MIETKERALLTNSPFLTTARVNVPHPFGNSDFVSVPEAAVRARVHKRTLYRWIAEGKLPAFGRGHATRVRMADVLAPKARDRR